MKSVEEFRFMKRCLLLAKRGEGNVHPNPMVGCVIVQGDKVVGEGYHEKFGGPHAEIIALKNAGKKAKGATMVVSLEPCVHFGKTPPCTDAVIRAGIARVVIASRDPNPLVGGKGIRRLRKAGVQVKIGVLQSNTQALNEKFFKYMRTGLPYVGIKLAQTLDGKIADGAGTSKWISSKAARTVVHRLRHEYDAVLVGAKTVLSDNPELRVRLIRGRDPVRVVVDGRLSLPTTRAIFNTAAAPTWLFTSSRAAGAKKEKIRKLVSQGVRILSVPSEHRLNARAILRTLAAEGVSSLLIEGGADTIDGFINQSLADKLYLFVSPKILGGGLNGFTFTTPRLLRTSIHCTTPTVQTIGEDLLLELLFIHD